MYEKEKRFSWKMVAWAVQIRVIEGSKMHEFINWSNYVTMTIWALASLVLICTSGLIAMFRFDAISSSSAAHQFMNIIDSLLFVSVSKSLIVVFFCATHDRTQLTFSQSVLARVQHVWLYSMQNHMQILRTKENTQNR